MRNLSTDAAAQALRDGRFVAHPTLGLWGLAADPSRDDTMRRLSTLKNAGERTGYIVITSRLEFLRGWFDASDALRRLMEHSFSGPVTVIARAARKAPTAVVSAAGTIAMRLERHPATFRLCELLRTPIVSTSLNLPGQPPVSDPNDMPAALAAEIFGVLSTEVRPAGIASTLVSAQGGQPQILRSGQVTIDEINRVWCGS